MQLDIDRQYGDIYKDGADFRRQLFELYQFTRSREEYQGWATDLRFITLAAGTEEQEEEFADLQADDVADSAVRAEDLIVSSEVISPASSLTEKCGCASWPDFHGRGASRTLQLTEPGSCPGCSHYVAVSYCWRSSEETAVAELDVRYTVETSIDERPSNAPTDILHRAISYAAHMGLSFIWIDQECIRQDDEKDKEFGIQSMDLVYQHSRHPLGLLNCYFDTQAEIDVFEHLIQGEPISPEEMGDLAHVLDILRDDLWFTRTWILQESTAGGLNMQLLAKHNPTLHKSVYLGEIPGELQISVFELQTAITWAEETMTNNKQSLERDLIQRLERATEKLWKFCPTHTPDSWERMENDPTYRQTCNAAQALSFMAARENSRVADRIAILGNMCDFPVRIDTTRLENGPYSFTTCALALAIFNGDLSLVRDDAAELSNSLGFSWGPPPQGSLSRLTYIEEDDDLFRLQPAGLTHSGLLVNGWLWKMDRSLDLRDVQAQYLERWDSSDTRTFEVLSTKAQFLKAGIIWSLLRKLVAQGLLALANMIWACTKRHELGPRSINVKRERTVLLPSSITEIIDPVSNAFTYICTPFVTSEDDFHEFFPGDSSTKWKGCQWLIDRVMSRGSIIVGHGISYEQSPIDTASVLAIAYCATFDVTETGYYVFTPSTVLDGRLAHTLHRSQPIWWLVEPGDLEGQESPVLKGTRLLRGYWANGLEKSAQLYTLS